MKIGLGGPASGAGVGAGFGAATSLVNALSSPYVPLGTPLVGTVWARTAKVLSLLMDAGWSWAALAVVTGWLAGAPVRGALAGALTLIGASVAYYVTDTLVLGASPASFVPEMVMWSVAGLLFGPVLGLVGAAVGRPGLTGLLAALTVPLGAAVQMVVMPPRPHLTLTPAIVLAEAIVWTAAVASAGWAVHRFLVERRSAASG
ncbi:hypothetical protein ACIBBD_17650 [Streptomyces sp. NPDC051315]|uniref:hypothetical protein n=1 Tax=Streptomyces sp. NPDC051315 TaxID=3365650 RepID=UPI0037903753